jgi:hypothetical protein
MSNCPIELQGFVGCPGVNVDNEEKAVDNAKTYEDCQDATTNFSDKCRGNAVTGPPGRGIVWNWSEKANKCSAWVVVANENFNGSKDTDCASGRFVIELGRQ